MAQEKVGRAVLELTTEGSFFQGIEAAKGQLRSLGSTIKQIQADNARLARSFGPQPAISQAVKLTNVIEQLGGATKLTAANQARANTILQQGVQAWNATGRAQTPAYQRMVQYAQATQQAIQPTASLTTNVGAMAAVGVIAGNAISNLVTQIAQIGGQSVLVAARTQTLTLAAEYLGTQTGATRDEVDALLIRLNKQGISMQEAANLVTQLSRANLGLEHATELAAIAQNTAAIAGLNSSETLNQIIQAIVTLQPRLLHTVGIMATLEGAEMRVAKETGRTMNSFTAEERQMILLNDVLRAGAQIQGTYAVTMQTVGKQLTSLPRFVQDAESSVGEVFLPTLSEAVTVTTELLKVIREYPKTFVAFSTSLLAGFAAGALFLGGVVGVSAGVVAAGAAIVGVIGLLTGYVSKVNDGTTAMRKFIAARNANIPLAQKEEDQYTTSQKELLKLAGTMHDAAAAQELVAGATDRTTDQLSDQEKKTIDSSVSWNNWIDTLEEIWARYKRLDFWTPTPVKPEDLPRLPQPPGMAENISRQPGAQMRGRMVDGKVIWDQIAIEQQHASQLTDGMLKEARDLGAAERLIAKSNADYQKELRDVGRTLDYYITHAKEAARFDLDTDEKLAEHLKIDASTVRRRREELQKLDSGLTPLEEFRKSLNKLTADLRTSTEKMSDVEFAREFGSKLDDAKRDLERFGYTGTQIPKEVREAFQRLESTRALVAFKKDLDTLTGDLQTATDKLSDAEFAKEFGSKLEDTARDLKRFGITGEQVPAEVTAALLRMNRIDLADWAQKEAAALSTLTDSIRGLGTGAAEAEERLIDLTGAALKEQEDIRNETAKNAADIDARRLQHDVTMAQQRGARWQQVYALERRLRERQLAESIRSANEEFKQRADAMDKTTQAGIDAYNMLRDEQRDVIRGMVEDFQLGEQEKLDELKRSHSRYLQLLQGLKESALRLGESLSGNLTTILFGMGHDPTGELRKAADDAKKNFEDIKKSGKATFLEIHKAAREWREAEERANYTFKQRFIDVWRSIKSAIQDILDQILKYFIESFIAGMIRGIAASRLGEWLGRTLRIGAGSAAAASAPWWLPAIPGAGGGAQPPPDVSKPLPQNPGNPPPADGGIVPLPTTPVPPPGAPGRGGPDPGKASITLSARVPAFGFGTSKLDFQNFGRSTIAVLHADEAVIPKGGGHRLASEIAAALSQFRNFSIPPLQMPMLAPAGPASMLMPAMQKAALPDVHIHQHNTIRYEASMIDQENADRHFERHTLPKLKHELTYNSNKLASLVKRAIKV